MALIYVAGGFALGLCVGAIFNVRIGAAVKALETTVETRLKAMESRIEAKLKAKL